MDMDIKGTILDLIKENKGLRLENRLYDTDKYYAGYADGYNGALMDLLIILKSSMKNS